MLSEHIDTSRLQNDIHLLIADCIHLKSLLRATWTRPMAEEQRRLVRARRKLTELFILQAFGRKKLHVTTAPREVRDAGGPSFDPSTWDRTAWAQAIVRRLLPDYLTAPTMTVAS